MSALSNFGRPKAKFRNQFGVIAALAARPKDAPRAPLVAVSVSDSQEPICAGLIAGAALVGIGDILVKVIVFG